jgi:hypothetical protein
MAKYCKKPVVVEVVRFLNDSYETLEAIQDLGLESIRVSYKDGEPVLIIETLEGEMIANVGDYIIRGIKGEFYPCKPDIFEQTYEPVDD